MIEKFNGIIYLIIFLVHFIGLGVYAFQLIIGTKKFREKFQIDETASTMMRMCGALFLGAVLMAIYIMFVRPGGVEGTWGFFNLVFVQNLCIFLVNTYSIKIDKTGIKNDSNEGVIAPLVFTILSAILIFGLSDKILFANFRYKLADFCIVFYLISSHKKCDTIFSQNLTKSSEMY